MDIDAPSRLETGHPADQAVDADPQRDTERAGVQNAPKEVPL
jgi:hypothetical protein